jgi:hypothetical protein
LSRYVQFVGPRHWKKNFVKKRRVWEQILNGLRQSRSW